MARTRGSFALVVTLPRGLAAGLLGALALGLVAALVLAVLPVALGGLALVAALGRGRQRGGPGARVGDLLGVAALAELLGLLLGDVEDRAGLDDAGGAGREREHPDLHGEPPNAGTPGSTGAPTGLSRGGRGERATPAKAPRALAGAGHSEFPAGPVRGPAA